MGRNAKLKEKQKWSHEKLHLENARKLRGIYFIDPEAKEFKETIKNARKNLETSVAPAMPCKIPKIVGVVHPTKLKQNLRVFWKLMNPQECAWEIRYRIITKTISQEKVKIHHSTTIWLINFSYTSSNENSCSESSGGQGMGKIGENFGVEPEESQK